MSMNMSDEEAAEYLRQLHNEIAIYKDLKHSYQTEALIIAIQSLKREQWFPYPKIKPNDIPENYLVTIKEGNNYHVAKRRWKDDKWLRWLHKGEAFIPKSFEGTAGVIAWKPLPEPYKENKE